MNVYVSLMESFLRLELQLCTICRAHPSPRKYTFLFAFNNLLVFSRRSRPALGPTSSSHRVPARSCTLFPHVPAYIVLTPCPTSPLKPCLPDPSQMYIRICHFRESFIYKPEITHKLQTARVYCSRDSVGRRPGTASDV